MKVAIVSGGTSGIGKGAVETLLDEGFKVVTFSRDKTRCSELAKEMKEVMVLQGDVSNEEDVQRIVSKTIEKYGRLDLIINNAGFGFWTSAEDVDIGRFREMIDTNVVGVASLTKHSLPHLKKSKGQIVNIASVAGKRGYPRGSFYCATKWAVMGYTESIRKELAGEVKVCAICPGMVKTNLFPDDVLSDRMKRPGFRIMDVEDTNRAIRLVATQSEMSDIKEIELPTS